MNKWNAIFETLNEAIEWKNTEISALKYQLENAQKENAELKMAIYSEMEENGYYTITDMLKDFQCLKSGDYTNQKISALMSALIKEGLVERVTDKRRSLFHKIGE